MIPVRFACLLWWIAASIISIGAIEQRDWHELIAQIAQVLIALVLWLSVGFDSDRFRAPRFGTRWLRLALYTITLLVSLVAFVPWQWPLGEVVMLRDAVVMVFAVMIVGPSFNADRKREFTP